MCSVAIFIWLRPEVVDARRVLRWVVKRDFRKIINCRQRPFFWKCPISQKKEKADSMIIQRADYNPDLIDWEGLTPEMIEKPAEELVLVS